MEERSKTGTGAVIGGVAGGVAGGAAAGAAVGGMTGPVGAALGAAVGAVVGAVTGKSIKVDPVAEDAYWRDNFSTRTYAAGGHYDQYGPAYRYGASAYEKYPGKTFEEVEPELGSGWASSRTGSSLDWDKARHASRDAWQRLSDRVERAVPGDSDRDGK